VHALIFIVEFIVMATARVKGQKFTHFVLIKREGAGISIGILVIFIVLAALAAWLLLYSVL